MSPYHGVLKRWFTPENKLECPYSQLASPLFPGVAYSLRLERVKRWANLAFRCSVELYLEIK